LTLTYADYPEDLEIPDGEETMDNNLTLVGIVGIEDPLRKEVPGKQINIIHCN
jgi:magnesium-transporting ATPase (P-type)